jgi:hypothetical protein
MNGTNSFVETGQESIFKRLPSTTIGNHHVDKK